MRALVFDGPHDARLEEVPAPVAGPGEVVCKVGVVYSLVVRSVATGDQRV